jgi:hypothetical protein
VGGVGVNPSLTTNKDFLSGALVFEDGRQALLLRLGQVIAPDDGDIRVHRGAQVDVVLLVEILLLLFGRFLF